MSRELIDIAILVASIESLCLNLMLLVVYDYFLVCFLTKLYFGQECLMLVQLVELLSVENQLFCLCATIIVLFLTPIESRC